MRQVPEIWHMWMCLHLNTKLEVICLCLISGSSEIDVGRRVWTDICDPVHHFGEQTKYNQLFNVMETGDFQL
jgi:hypothetical protein